MMGQARRARRQGAGNGGVMGVTRGRPGGEGTAAGRTGPAPRWRTPGWRDPRLQLGLVLVAASVALGSWLVTTAGRTTPVYAAAHTLVPGDELTAADLVVRDVRVPGVEAYLPAAEMLAEGTVVVRTVGEGELVPRAATAQEAGIDLRRVAVTSRAGLSAAVVVGSLVDLWFVPEQDATTPDAVPPTRLAAGLTVAEVGDDGGGLAVGSGATVHLLVSEPDLPDVLAALAAPGTVEVVPVPGGSP